MSCNNNKKLTYQNKKLLGGESNPGLLCDRQGYSPLYYQGCVTNAHNLHYIIPLQASTKAENKMGDDQTSAWPMEASLLGSPIHMAYGRELNPSLLCDRQRYSPLYYQECVMKLANLHIIHLHSIYSLAFKTSPTINICIHSFNTS